MSSIASSQDDAQLAFPRSTRSRTLSSKARPLDASNSPPSSPPLTRKESKPNTPKRERVRSFVKSVVRRASSSKILKRDSGAHERHWSPRSEKAELEPEARSFEVVGVFHTQPEHPSPALSALSSSYSDSSPPPLFLPAASVHSRSSSSNTMASVHQGVLGAHKRQGSNASIAPISDRASETSTAFSGSATHEARLDKGDAPDVIIEAPAEEAAPAEEPAAVDPALLVESPPALGDAEVPNPFVVDDSENGASSDGAASPPVAAAAPGALSVPAPSSGEPTPSSEVALTPVVASPAPEPEVVPEPEPEAAPEPAPPAPLSVPAPAPPVQAPVPEPPVQVSVPEPPAQVAARAPPVPAPAPAPVAQAPAPASPLDVHKPMPAPPPRTAEDSDTSSEEDEFDPQLFVPALVLPTLFLPIPNVRPLLRSSLYSCRRWWSRQTMDGPYALLWPASVYAVGLLVYRARR